MSILISVIIPTYKPQKYLWTCLDSLMHQTFPKNDYEVILVLNGCCDPYRKEIEKYISTVLNELNINFIQTDIGGVSNARNIALDCAKGDYITFIDDDDYVSPFYLEQLFDKASNDTVSLCYPLMFKDGTTDFKPYSITGDYIRNCNKIRCVYYHARKFFSGPVYKLIHRDIIGNRRFDEKFKNGEDSLFMFSISDRMRFVDFTSKDAIYYRRVRENSAVTTRRSRMEIIRNAFNMIVCYTKIYLSSPFSYSFYFYFTRLLGAVKIMFYK